MAPASDSETHRDFQSQAETEEEDDPSENEEESVVRGKSDTNMPLKVLPMYAMLPSSLQQRVFEETNDQTRYVIPHR